jgi:ribosomal protein S18 acetylase RimI-like enzyme
MQTATIEADGATIEVFVVPWDTRIFGFTVAQISRIDLGGNTRPAGLIEAFDAWCTEHGVEFVTCRLDHLRLPESMLLESVGFRFVEMVYEPRLEPLGPVPEPRHRIDIAEGDRDDVDAIASIAHEVFSTGRFLLDWRLPAELSKRRYADWVRTSFDSSEQQVLKAEADGALVGFFIVERRADDSVYWHLTAIAPGHQGQGLGLSLWLTMLRRHEAEGASGVRTTISGHNVPVMNLYARLGFSLSAPQMTFHWLRGQ